MNDDLAAPLWDLQLLLARERRQARNSAHAAPLSEIALGRGFVTVPRNSARAAHAASAQNYRGKAADNRPGCDAACADSLRLIAQFLSLPLEWPVDLDSPLARFLCAREGFAPDDCEYQVDPHNAQLLQALQANLERACRAAAGKCRDLADLKEIAQGPVSEARLSADRHDAAICNLIGDLRRAARALLCCEGLPIHLCPRCGFLLFAQQKSTHRCAAPQHGLSLRCRKARRKHRAPAID